MASGFTPSSSPSFSAKEKNNHTRLSRLLIDIGRRVVQDVFDSIHPPSSLHRVLNSARVQNQLQRLRTRRILYEQQWNLLYPTTGIAESKNFDITLLFLLLRNICGLKPPASTGSWDKEPSPTDLSVEADLVRIKRCRNELYAHRVGMALTDDEFDNNWNDIEAALNRLGRSRCKKQIERLKFASIDHENDMCFYALVQSWGESENAIRKLDETLAKGKIEIIREIQKINEKLEENSENDKYDETQREILEEIQKLNENVGENKQKVGETEILQQIKILNGKLDDIAERIKDAEVEDISLSQGRTKFSQAHSDKNVKQK